MRIECIKQSDSGNALIVFSGWSTGREYFDDDLFSKINDNILFVNCYTDLDDKNLFEAVCEFESISIVAWSFGVWVAGRFILNQKENLKFSQFIAVNGTLSPIDRKHGIHPAIAEKTLNSLQKGGYKSFLDAMGPEAYSAANPCSDNEERISELDLLIKTSQQLSAVEAVRFAPIQAYVGTLDRIMPAKAQVRSWQALGINPIELTEPHFSRSLFKQSFAALRNSQ